MSSCGRLLSNNGSVTFLFVHFQSKKKDTNKIKRQGSEEAFSSFLSWIGLAMYWNLIMWLLLYSNPGPFAVSHLSTYSQKKKTPQKIIEKEASSLVISSKPPNLEVKTKVTAPAVAPRGWLQLNWETERRKYSANSGSRVEPELRRNNCDGGLLFNKKPPSQMSQLLCLDQSNYRNNSQTDAKKGDRCCDKPEVCFKATYGEDLN